jgi:capsular exopolysaccharide synthesis family protein
MPNRDTPPSATRSPAATPLFDATKLVELLHIIRERWILGLALGLTLGGLFILWRIQEVPTFRASGVLSVKLETEQVIDIEAVEQTSLRGPLEAELNQHMRQLSSQGFLERVANSLSAAEASAIVTPYRESGQPAPAALSILGSGLDLRYISNSRMIEIGFLHREPNIAADVVNRILEQYPRYLLERPSQSTRSAIAYLSEQSEALRKKVEQSEMDLQAYRQKHQLVSLEEGQNIIVARLKALNAALTDAQVRLSSVQSQTTQIAAMRATGDDLAELAFIGRSGALPNLIEQIKRLELERSLLDERYLARHPKMVENTRALEAVRQQKAELIRQVVTEIENHEAQIQLEIERLGEELAKAEQEALALDQRAIEYNVLRQQLANDRQSYQMVLQRLNETQITRDLSLSNIEIVDPARIPWKPFAPDRRTIFLRAGFLFCLGFFGLPIGLHYLNDKVRRFSDVEAFLHAELIGDIPKTPLPKEPVQDRIPDDHMRQCYAALVSRIEQLGGDFRPKGIVFTSSIPREGKTTVTHHVGLTLAENGHRVLLVDLDWRRPSLGGVCGVRNELGLLHWLRKGGKLPDDPEQARRLDDLGIALIAPNCELLPAGGHDKYPLPLLQKPALAELFRLLRQRYDYILFDTPPIGVFPDATVAARFADEAVFVCRQNAVSHRRARFLLDRLDETPATVLGVVLNVVKSGGGDSYRGNYGYGYSYEQKSYRSYYAEAEKDAKG